MSLMKIILSMVLIGAGLWAVNTYVPMTNTVKAWVNVVLIALICLWLAQTFGVIDGIKNFKLQ